IGKQIAAVQARLDDLADRSVDGVVDAEERALCDRLADLDTRLTWTRPQSLAGVCLLVAQIGVVADMLGDEADPVRREADLRQVQRLGRLAIDGLERLGGLDRAAIGTAMKVVDAPDFWPLVEPVA
uniref:hypothetical protein n=1 Tax=uncultured Phenylobacterium sp. TaxID=349273 RepID=UPI0025DDF8D5